MGGAAVQGERCIARGRGRGWLRGSGGRGGVIFHIRDL